jgi:hypothetical protein
MTIAKLEARMKPIKHQIVVRRFRFGNMRRKNSKSEILVKVSERMYIFSLM